MALIVHVINGNIRMLIEVPNTESSVLAGKFPIGDVYVRMLEPRGAMYVQQWRVLVRGTRAGDKHSFYDAILPITVEQLPECVQVVHMCTE